MSLSDNDKQRYINVLGVARSEIYKLLIKLGYPSNIIHDINTKIYTHVDKLLNNIVNK
jgi:hypothetical protein